MGVSIGEGTRGLRNCIAWVDKAKISKFVNMGEGGLKLTPCDNSNRMCHNLVYNSRLVHRIDVRGGDPENRVSIKGEGEDIKGTGWKEQRGVKVVYIEGMGSSESAVFEKTSAPV